MRITKDEYIITAFADSASGPGWGNKFISVIVQNPVGELRQEYIQPDDQTPEMVLVALMSEAAHRTMTRMVKCWIEKKRKK